MARIANLPKERNLKDYEKEKDSSSYNGESAVSPSLHRRCHSEQSGRRESEAGHGSEKKWASIIP